MKYALVEGDRQEAQPGRSGSCPACGSSMIAKCGKLRVKHWAHQGKRNCDTWWENETEWHRNWKNQFPVDWQENVHRAENDERHIADVKTDQGWVLEFQHSRINPDERIAREVFYQRQLIWIVDGTRRKRDHSQFMKVLKDGMLCIKEFNLSKIPFPDECALLRDWMGSNALVLFDFFGCGKSEDQYLWCLIKVVKGMAYVGPFRRDSFIKYHCPEAMINKMDFSELLKNINEGIDIISQPREDNSPLASMLRRQPRMRRL